MSNSTITHEEAVAVMKEFGWRKQENKRRDVRWIKQNLPAFMQHRIKVGYISPESEPVDQNEE